MEKIPYETISDIQKRVNIVDVISKYLPITKRGKNYFAICPFHDDHNPSMSISEEKQIYTCFVCGASGNVFTFVQNYEKISFTSAVKKVASFIGINIDIKDDYKVQNNNLIKYDKYYNMFSLATKLYQNNIRTVYGKEAKKYLHNRSIDDDIIKEFNIGLSLNDNELSKLLESKGYIKEDMVDIGLCGIKDNYTYDIFRGRIMFPLEDSGGKVIGFSGRIYNTSSDNKYVNSKESVIFKKGNLLYNYKRASEYAREKDYVIVVEGFMDVIRLYTIGIKNVVATMGTAITSYHAKLIRRLSKNIILCFDGDKAGAKATKSALKELEKIDLVPKIIRLEDDLDPDDYIIKKGKESFITHLNNPMTSLAFKLESDKKDIDFNDYNDISKYISSIASELEKIDDKVVLELTLKKVSKETNVDVETIRSLIKNNTKEEKKIIDKPRMLRKNKYEKAEEYLVYYMLRDTNVIDIYINKISYLSNKVLGRIVNKILEFYDKKHYINVTDFTLYLEDDTELINEVLRIDSYDMPSLVNNSVIDDYINTIDDGIIKREIIKTKESIKTEGDIAKKIILLDKLQKLKKKEYNYGRN